MIDFKKLLEDNNIKTRVVVKKWINVCCPFCKNPIDTHFNGNFSLETPAYNCWRCGKHYWAEALSLLLGMNPIMTKKLASEYGNLPQSRFIKKDGASRPKRIELPGFSELTEKENKYLVERGFDVDYLKKKFGIQGGGIAGKWSFRIILPIFYEGKLVSWTGRSILPRSYIDENEIPRYKNLSVEESVVNPKDIFFNLDNSNKREVILVEGPFDVLKMGDDCICSLGTSVTNNQKLLLLNKYRKIYIAFDNEVSAQKKAHKLGEELSSVGLDVEVVNICEDYNKNDPGELIASEVTEIKNELFSFSRFPQTQR